MQEVRGSNPLISTNDFNNLSSFRAGPGKAVSASRECIQQFFRARQFLQGQTGRLVYIFNYLSVVRWF